MQVTIEDVGALTKRLNVVLPSEYVGKKLDEAYEDLKTKVNLKGFRKGKIPRKVLEKNYSSKVEHEVAEKMIQDTYFDALQESKLDAVVHPEIREHKFNDSGAFSYEAEIDIRPHFEVAEYKGIEVEQAEVEITDDEVNAAIDALRKQMAPLKTVSDRGVQNDDTVVLDFQGYQNGEAMKQVVGKDYSVLVGSGRNGQEFEENLIGLKSGEETSFTIEFPEAFANPVLAGKNVEFRITVKDVKEYVLPELDDEFAKDVGEEFATLEDLKNHLRDTRKKEREDAQVGDITDKIMLKLLENHKFDVPGRLVGYEVSALIKEMEDNLMGRGMSLESAGLNRESLVEQYKEAAERRVRGDFILKKIGEVEKIKLENADIDAGFKRISERYNMPVSEVKKYFQNRDDLLPFMNELLSEKILAFLREEAKITKVAPEAVSTEEAGGQA